MNSFAVGSQEQSLQPLQPLCPSSPQTNFGSLPTSAGEDGGSGIVVGACTVEDAGFIEAKLPENNCNVHCHVEKLSKTPPALPGGFQVGQDVFYVDDAYQFPTGDFVMYGGKGIAMGAHAMEGYIYVKFPKNTWNVNCHVKQLSKTPLALPGGFQVGQDVFFLGDFHGFPSGDSVGYGRRGTVMGAQFGYSMVRIFVNFPENTWYIPCIVEQLSQTPPALPGGFQEGEDVYFVSAGETLCDGDALMYGVKGIVTGTGKNKGYIKVKFPQNKNGHSCKVGELSKTPPGPLPEGFQVGEAVYFVGGGETLPTGDFVVYGGMGTVISAGTRENEGRIRVTFPQNKWDVACKAQELSKTPPGPLPEGFQVGETVYFVGGVRVLSNGDAAIYGGKGIVMGAGTGENVGLLVVKFPQNEGNVPCSVEELSKTAPGRLLSSFQATEQTHLALQKLQAERDLALGRLQASFLPHMPRTLELRGPLPDIPLNSPLGKFVCSLITSTTVRHRVELDSSEFGDAPRLRVLRIEDVRSPILYEKYMTAVQELHDRHRVLGCAPFDVFPHLRVDAASSPAGQVNVNECFAMHGCPSEVVAELCKGGFDPQRARDGKFGRGSYFAVNSSKCDRYTDPVDSPRRPRAWERKMIVARLALGRVFRLLDDSSDSIRPPDGYDSCWADTRQNGGRVDYPELVIFKEQQALPLYVITYIHECPPDALCSECRQRPNSHMLPLELPYYFADEPDSE